MYGAKEFIEQLSSIVNKIFFKGHLSLHSGIFLKNYLIGDPFRSCQGTIN